MRRTSHHVKTFTGTHLLIACKKNPVCFYLLYIALSGSCQTGIRSGSDQNYAADLHRLLFPRSTGSAYSLMACSRFAEPAFGI